MEQLKLLRKSVKVAPRDQLVTIITTALLGAGASDGGIAALLVQHHGALILAAQSLKLDGFNTKCLVRLIQRFAVVSCTSSQPERDFSLLAYVTRGVRSRTSPSMARIKSVAQVLFHTLDFERDKELQALFDGKVSRKRPREMQSKKPKRPKPHGTFMDLGASFVVSSQKNAEKEEEAMGEAKEADEAIEDEAEEEMDEVEEAAAELIEAQPLKLPELGDLVRLTTRRSSRPGAGTKAMDDVFEWGQPDEDGLVEM